MSINTPGVTRPIAAISPKSSDFIDFSALARIHVALDWIRFRITLKNSAQGKDLKTAFDLQGCTYFEPRDPVTDFPAPWASTTFVVTLQNPTPQRALAIFNMIGDAHPFSTEPEIVGMETTAWLRFACPPGDLQTHKEQLAELGELVYRNLRQPAHATHHRILIGPRKWKGVGSRQVNRAALADGYSIRIGHNSDEIGQRIYCSFDDRKSKSTGSRRPLPVPLWGVKLELITQGAAQPFQTLQGWIEYDFRKLSQPYLALRKPRAGVAIPTGITCFAKAEVIGAAVKKHGALTVADTDWTRLIRAALNNLTRRNKTGW